MLSTSPNRVREFFVTVRAQLISTGGLASRRCDTPSRWRAGFRCAKGISVCTLESGYSIEMTNTPRWEMCVLTGPGGYSDLKNALLYADHVHWVSLEPAVATMTSIMQLMQSDGEVSLGSGMSATKVRLTLKRDDEPERSGYLELPEPYLAMCGEMDASGLRNSVTHYLDTDSVGRNFSPIVDLFIRTVQTASATNPVIPYAENYIVKIIEGALRKSRVLMIPSQVWSTRHPGHWDAYVGAHVLFKAVSHLLLPDVSDLPLGALAEARDKLSDFMDPMRAELLCFTEQLRETVGDGIEQSKLQAEADNLIAVRVEPVVRQAAARVRELVDKKWRGLFKNAAKAVGLAGAACIDPRLLAKAVQQTTETIALTFADPADNSSPSGATAQFVLTARSVLVPPQR